MEAALESLLGLFKKEDIIKLVYIVYGILELEILWV